MSKHDEEESVILVVFVVITIVMLIGFANEAQNHNTTREHLLQCYKSQIGEKDSDEKPTQ